ncbi:F0F1 ATP synthase subunit B/delta [Gordonia sinesedis]
MDIFIGQLIGFALIAFLFWKYVLPPLRKAVRARQNAISEQVAESEAAKQRVLDAEQAQARAKEQADAEAKELHEGALQDAESIRGDLRQAADAEVKRIDEHGKAQAELTRSGMVRKLRSDLGLSAVGGADALVREHLADPANQAQNIDRVIDDLGQMAGRDESAPGIPTSSDIVGLRSMRASSRDAARAVSADFDAEAANLDGAALTTAADDLTDVLVFLADNPVLRKRITEDDENPEGKKRLVHTLFDGKVSPLTVSILATAAAQRWSSTTDFVTALRRQDALIVLTAAERDGVIEQVEDELFRVSRVLEANPMLASLLSDYTHPADKRVELLRKLVGDQVGPYTWTLLAQTIRLLNGQQADTAFDNLAELAAARRGEVVAHVTSAVPLTDAQRARLAEVLGRIYRRNISVQTEIDPEIIGGLRIAVGDEVIEADVATRLAKAAQDLPR